jgi:hypothetical protein
MKKMMITVLLSAALISAVAAFDAEVVSAKGKVEVQKNGVWTALSQGSKLIKGDIIQTGFRSELELKIKETIVKVEPLSRLTIEQLAEKETKDDTRLHLATGSLKANVKKTENRRVGFTVKSPVATASVRGTELGVTNTFQSTDIETYAGSVATWASDNSEAEIASDEEDNAPETPPAAGAGNTPEAVSDGQAPANATLVKAGQSTGYNQSGTTESPESKASQGARSLGGGTSTAAAGEAVVMGSSADQATAGAVAVAETPAGSGSTVSSTGRVIVNVTW